VPIPDLDKWLPHMAPRASELIPLPPDDKVPVWVQEKEARRCAMVLAEYVQHLSLVMHRAYPLPIGQSFMMPKTTTTTKSISVASMEPVDHSEDDGRYDDVME